MLGPYVIQCFLKEFICTCNNNNNWLFRIIKNYHIHSTFAYHPTFWALLTIVAAFILPCFFHQFSKSVIFFAPSLPMCHSLGLYPVIHRKVNIRGIVFLYTLTLRKQMRNANKICLIFFLKRLFSHYSYLSSVALPFKTWLRKIDILRLVKIPLLLLYGQYQWHLKWLKILWNCSFSLIFI